MRRKNNVMKSEWLRRASAMCLVLLMIVSMLPTAVFAVSPEASYNTKLTFHKVDGSGTWYLNSSEALPSASSAPYLSATVKVDGVDKKIAFENNGAQLVIWSGFFEVYSSGIPTSSFEIPEGTVLKECTTTAGWGEVSGGTQITVDKTLKVTNDGTGNWGAAVEPEATVNTALQFSNTDSGNTWYFTSSEALPSTASAAYLSATIQVDGAEKKVVFENNGTQLVIWSGFFEVYSSGVPISSLEIPVGTVLSECATTGAWDEILGGTQIITTNTIKVEKDGSGNWNTVIEPEDVCETKIDFDKVDGSGTWYFNSTETLPSASNASLLSATVKIDGAEKKILFENNGTQLVVWSNFFEVYGASVPTEKLEIPAGTVLSEITPIGAWDAVLGGTQIVSTEAVTITKDGAGNWSTEILPEEICETNAEFDKVDGSNTWYFHSTATLPPATNASLLSATVKIDGAEKKILFENNGTQLVVWSNFFEVYGASVPTEKLEIPAGTVLSEITPTGAWDAVLGGTQIVIQNALSVQKDGSGNWNTLIEPEAVCETEIGFSQADSGNNWYFTSSETLPTNVSAPYFCATVKIDGEEKKIAFENTGTQLVVWAGFFDVYGAGAPTLKLEILKDTVFSEIDPSNGWSEIVGGTQIVATKGVTVVKNASDAWEETILPEAAYETEVSFGQVDGNNTWYFNSSEALPSTEEASYFTAVLTLDGTDTKIAFENTGTQLVVWAGFFELYGGAAPTACLEIPAGTVLYEMTTTDWSNVIGGTQITITETLKVEKNAAGNWGILIAPEAEVETELKFYQVDAADSWYFNATEALPANASAPYFTANVIIDGQETKIAIENNGSQLIVWSPGFFEVYGGSVPTTSFEIPKGTVLYEISTTDWNPISGGTQITVTQTLEVNKTGSEWIADAKPETVYNTELSLRTVDVLESWYINSSKALPKVETAKYFIATATIDGKETKIVMENDGSQLVIWKSFFEVFGGSAPTTSFVLPKDTILYEMNDENWSILAGGIQIVLNAEFRAQNDSDGSWGVGATPAPKQEENTLNFVRCNFMTVSDWVAGSAMKSGSFSISNGMIKGTVRGNSSGETLLSFSGSDYLDVQAGEKYKVIITYKSSVSFGVFMNLKSNAWKEAPGVCAATEDGEWVTLSATFKPTAGDAFHGVLIQSWNTEGAYDLQIKEFCIVRDDDTISLEKTGTVGLLPECEGEDDPLGRFVYEWVMYTKSGKSVVLTDHMSMDKVRSILGSTGTYYAYERLKCVHHMDDGADYGKEPTCTEGGWAPYYICKNCQAILSDYLCTVEITDLEAWKAGEGKLEPTGHVEMTEEIAMDGNVYYRCKCGKLFELDGENYVEVSESVLNNQVTRDHDAQVSTDSNDKQNTDLWNAVYIVLGVIALCVAVVVIVLIVKKRKDSNSNA